MTERWRKLSDAEVRFLGLGDLVELAARKLGIRACPGCKRRQVALNRVAPRVVRRRARP
jgi:hypothetical protein